MWSHLNFFAIKRDPLKEVEKSKALEKYHPLKEVQNSKAWGKYSCMETFFFL